MGFVLSKFRKSKPSIKDELEKIDKDLRGIQRFQLDTEIKQKRIIGKLTLLGFVLYVISIVGYYFFAPTHKWTFMQIGISILPFIVFPVLLYYLRVFLGWWYQRKIVQNKEKSVNLKKEKERLLEEVMDKETFKVAKEILEKYAPSHLLPKYLADAQRASPAPQTPTSRLGVSQTGRISLGGVEFNEGLRRRQMTHSTPIAGRFSTGPGPQPNRFPGSIPPGAQMGRLPFRPQHAAIMAPPGTRSMGPGPNTPAQGIRPSFASAPTGLTPMRFMLPQAPANPIVHNRKTGWMDRLVDYVVGDGPTHRYALICRYCATHNGLAPPDDFPYTGYRCIYCRQFNPPREQRPSAATLPRNTVLIEEMESTLKSETSGISEEESENEKENKNDKVEDAPDPVIELSGSTSDLSRRSSDLTIDTINENLEGDMNKSESKNDDRCGGDDGTQTPPLEDEIKDTVNEKFGRISFNAGVHSSSDGTVTTVEESVKFNVGNIVEKNEENNKNDIEGE